MIKCQKNIKLLSRFKDEVVYLEKKFNSSWGSNTALNNFFFKYEKDVMHDHLICLNHQKQEIDSNQYILFENKHKQHLKKEMENLPNSMENPYKILRRFLTWEIMDLQALIEAILNRSIIEKKKN